MSRVTVDAAYFRRHRMVFLARGKASSHRCEGCRGRARDWSQIHDRDGESPEDYRPLCRRCHVAYDEIPSKGFNQSHPGESNGRAVLSTAKVREIRERYQSGRVSQTKLAEEYGVAQQHISRIINGCQRSKE